MKRLENFFISYQPQLLFCLVIFIFLYFFSGLPYLGLILDKKIILYILWVVAILIFRVPGRFSIKAALISLLFSLPLLLLQREKLAEEMGNLAYEFLLVGIIQELVGYLRERKKYYKKLLK